MTQTTLPFAKNSRTSRAAAKSMWPYAPTDAGRVLHWIKANGGCTCDEIEYDMRLKHQTASARINGLRNKGFIKDSGRTRPTRSGRKAVVWVTS